MPIGKNSLQRVVEAKGANIQTAAPDMEDSVPVAVKKPANGGKATAVKKAPAGKSAAVAKKASVKQAVKSETIVQIGESLPVYLL